MTKQIDFSLLNVGDRLVRTKGGIFTKHHALYMGIWENKHLIAENQNGFGIRYYLLDQFLSEGSLERVDYNNYPENSQVIIIDRVNKKIGTSYNALTYNCEHFVEEILNGVAKSKQVQNVIAVGAGVGVGVSLCYLAFKLLNDET